jgi:hypothetical protein
MAKTKANAKMTKTPSLDIFIATPMFGGMCYGSYVQSLANLVGVFMNANVTCVYDSTYSEALVTRARDILADNFMQSDCSHLMFIDADIGFDARDILSMVAADKDIICGLYPRKQIEWEQVAQAARSGVPAEELHRYSGAFPVNGLSGADIYEAIESSDQQPIEIKNAGTGFMLIKREVLEGLADKVPQYYPVVGGLRVPRARKQYFNTSIDPIDNIQLPEDYTFCKLARDNGFRIWAAPWAVLSHTGTYMYTGRP